MTESDAEVQIEALTLDTAPPFEADLVLDEPEQPSEPVPSSYEVSAGDDLKEVFNAGFETISGSEPPTALQYVLAYAAGYMVRSNENGWTANKR